MLSFDYDTARAEINAMPALPDCFEILAPTDFVRRAEKIRTIHVSGYSVDIVVDRRPRFVYRIIPLPATPFHSVQDILLNRYREHTKKVY